MASTPWRCCSGMATVAPPCWWLRAEMAGALGHLALGLCASEQPEALPLTSGPAASPSSKATAALLCPVGCGTRTRQRALLLSLYDKRAEQVPAAVQSPEREKELLLLARRLGELLADDGPDAGHGKSQ